MAKSFAREDFMRKNLPPTAYSPDDEHPPSGKRVVVEILAMIAASLLFGLVTEWLVRALTA